MNPTYEKGLSLQTRVTLAVLFSATLMFVDSHSDTFSKIRASYLDTLVSPLFYIANTPNTVLSMVSESVVPRTQLQQENKALHQELLLKNSELLVLRQLQQENKQLRKLLSSSPKEDEYKMVTQVLTMEINANSDQLVINKGSRDGVYEGQPVVNDNGVVGQVIAVAYNTSRVLLVCDATHAIPIQVLRNDIRGIAVGNGCMDDLQVEYLQPNADIEIGDELVTSGLGGNFAEGYPVAIVTSVRVDNQRARTVIYAKPLVSWERLRYLLLIWTPEKRETFELYKKNFSNSKGLALLEEQDAILNEELNAIEQEVGNE